MSNGKTKEQFLEVYATKQAQVEVYKKKRLSIARKSDLTMEWMKACELWLGIQL